MRPPAPAHGRQLRRSGEGARRSRRRDAGPRARRRFVAEAHSPARVSSCVCVGADHVLTMMLSIMLHMLSITLATRTDTETDRLCECEQGHTNVATYSNSMSSKKGLLHTNIIRSFLHVRYGHLHQVVSQEIVVLSCHEAVPTDGCTAAAITPKASLSEDVPPFGGARRPYDPAGTGRGGWHAEQRERRAERKRRGVRHLLSQRHREGFAAPPHGMRPRIL